MGRLLESFIVIVPGLFVVILLVVVGVYYLQRLRRESRQDSDDGVDALTRDFLNIHREGGITEEEFRAIRAKLSSREHGLK